jgi:hypothetical protein
MFEEPIIHETKNTKTKIVLVSKDGSLSECVVEPGSETTIEQLAILLSKKCGYRKHDGFSCYHTYRYKNKRKLAFDVSSEEVVPKYIYVDVWGKTDGRAGYENKYEMPPPIDELLFYGNIALVARMDELTAIHLTTDIWNVIYEKLFGGFEDLAATAIEDENEIDELDSIPSHKKTRSGYLKDGFVVDDEDATPRGIVKGRGGKKNKSESTESEFITETETESGTPTTTSDADADADELVVECKLKNVNVKVKTNATAVKPKRVGGATASKNTKSKKPVEEPVGTQDSESELSEEEYV